MSVTQGGMSPNTATPLHIHWYYTLHLLLYRGGRIQAMMPYYILSRATYHGAPIYSGVRT